MSCTAGTEEIDHKLKKLDVPALVTRHRNTMRIFLNGGINNFCDGPVMPQMYDLAALVLQDAPNNTNRSIVAVEERGSRHETQRGVGSCYDRQCALDRMVGHSAIVVMAKYIG
jgi:hypothetical protein